MTYRQLLDKIPLLDYLLAVGYELDTKKSSSKWVVLEKDSDKIVVNSVSGLYFNPTDNTDKGDLIQFVANRVCGMVLVDHSKEAKFKAVTVLRDFILVPLDKDVTTKATAQKKALAKKKLLSDISDSFNHSPIKDYIYLTKERMISPKTIDHPIFKGRIFNSFFQLKNGHIITNYAFGKYIDQKLVGLEVRNTNLKHVSGDDTGIFHSDYSGFDTVDVVFIAESTLDALSYFELFSNHRQLHGKNCVFISTAGNLYPEKYNQLKNCIGSFYQKHARGLQIVSITDNDAAGNLYDHFLLANFMNDFSIFPTAFSCDKSLFYVYEITALDTASYNGLNDLVAAYNDRIGPGGSLGDYVVVKKNKALVTLHIPLTVTLGDPFMVSFQKLLQIQHLCKIHKPPKGTSDWNDYLQLKKKEYLSQNKKNRPLKKRHRL